MTYDLPLAVEIDGQEHKIRNECDYRVVMDVIAALNDEDIDESYRVYVAMKIFFADFDKIQNYAEAVKQMYAVISGGEGDNEPNVKHPDIVDWEKDFKLIAAAVAPILGYDIRTPGKYTHWWTLTAAFMEIHEGTYSTVLSIRQKRAKGKQLEKWEREFVREHPNLTALPQRLTAEEKEFLFGDD